jgi:hypothetical protein
LESEFQLGLLDLQPKLKPREVQWNAERECQGQSKPGLEQPQPQQELER